MSSEYALSELCSLIVDCPHSTPVWKDGGVVVLRNQNIKGGRLNLSSPSFTDEENYLKRIKRAAPSAGDIVITREAPMGDVCEIPKGLRCCLGQRQVLLRTIPEKMDSKFLLFALQSEYVQHQIGWNEGTGSTVSNLRIPVLEALKIPTPSILRQREVATTLSALDDRITLLRETNATLEAIAQALFKSWFVDFDPVRAKMEGREPEGMDAETAALFPDSFEKSELGLVPKGWRQSTLGEICDSHGGQIQTGPFGSQLHASDYVDSGVPVVMPKDLINRRINELTAACITPDYVTKLSRHKMDIGDIVFSRRGDVEKHALIGVREQGWICGTGCLLVRPGIRWGSSCYLSYSLDQQKTKTWITQHAVGATMPNLNTGILSAVPVVLPAEQVLQVFENIVGAIEQRISSNNECAKSLSEIRDTLLPRLISGQLRLPEVEEQIEEAVA